METEQTYSVEISPEAEQYYFDLLKNLYSTHAKESADKKSDEILEMAMLLDKMPNRGSEESLLSYLGKDHKYLIYKVTSRRTIKIIYFIEESSNRVYVTDFFPTMMDADEIVGRNKS